MTRQLPEQPNRLVTLIREMPDEDVILTMTIARVIGCNALCDRHGKKHEKMRQAVIRSAITLLTFAYGELS